MKLPKWLRKKLETDPKLVAEYMRAKLRKERSVREHESVVEDCTTCEAAAKEAALRETVPPGESR